MPTLDGRLLNDRISEMQCHRCCLTGLRARRPVPVRAFFAADIIMRLKKNKVETVIRSLRRALMITFYLHKPEGDGMVWKNE